MLSCHILIFIFTIFLPNVLLEHVPIITQNPKDSFPKYRSLELSCHADGDPLPDILWYNSETKKKIIDHITVRGIRYAVKITNTTQQSRLLISEPGRRVEFVVYCNASNSLGHAVSPPAAVGKAYLGGEFDADPPSIKEAYPGTTVKLSCKPPKGRPIPKVTWLKNGLAIDIINNARYIVSNQFDSYGSQISTLKITNSNSEDSGLYQCLAENSYGTEKSSTSTLSFRNYLKVAKEFTFTISTTANISCPIPTIRSLEWLRQDGQKVDTSRMITGTDYLIISNIQVSDSGKYVCRARLMTGNSMEALVNVIVQSPATFLLTPEDKSVLEGDDISFKCIVSGYPLPEVYWELPGLGALFPEDSTYSRFQVKKDGSLYISNVQLTDAGKYTCNCHSSLDARHSSAHLTVKKRELANYPVISLPPQNQTLLEGSTATFRCEVVSHMEATITWFRGPQNEPLQAGDRISVPTRGALQIKKIDPTRDTNIYTCEASLKNDGMKTRWTAFLRVIYPDSGIPVMTPLNDESQLPLAPVLDTPVEKSWDSVNLSWSSSGQVKYWIEYVRFGSSDGWIIYKKDWPDIKITIKNLKPNSWYQFLVRARNSKGLSRASVPTEYVKTLSREDSRSTSKYDIKDRKVLSMFSQIQINIVNIHPIPFGKVKMEWQINVPEPLIINYIDGFKVRFTMIPLSRCFDEVNYSRLSKENYCSLARQSDNDIRNWVLQNDMLPMSSGTHIQPNLTSGIADIRLPVLDLNSVLKSLVTGLSPFSCYELSVDAYSDMPVTSQESSSRLSLMIEDIPSQPPLNIRTFWSQIPNTLVIQWQLPPKHSWNGILTGFVVHIFVNDSQTLLGSMKFNKTSTDVKIHNLDQKRRYSLHMSLYNCRGEGIRSQRILVPHKSNGSSAYEQQAWFIPVIVIGTLIFWVLLCCLVVYLCCVRFHLIANGPKLKSKDRELNLEPLITSSIKDPRFCKSLTKNGHDYNKTIPEALYSETSIINPNHMTSCSITSSTCTPYASASIVDPTDNFYTGSLIDELGPAPTAILPPYLTYAPQYAAYSHASGMMPYSMTTSPLQNILCSTSNSNNINVNSTLYNLKEENHQVPNVQHNKYINQNVNGNNWPVTVKMGIGQLGSSTSGTSSSGSVVQKKSVESKTGSMCAVNNLGVSPANFGSATSSPSAVANDCMENDERKGVNESPKSTVHYDVIPNGETGDEFCEYSSQSSDTNECDYESGNELHDRNGNLDVSPITTVIDDSNSQHSPGYSTDSITYSAVPHRPYPKSSRRRQMRNKYQTNITHKSKL